MRRSLPIKCNTAWTLAALVLLATAARADVGGATAWAVDASGAATNGGGFDPGNANMATDLAATLATGTAPVVTSASYNFTTRDNGHWLFVKAGTNWRPGWYQIATTGGNAATLTATIGSAPLYNSSTPINTAAGCATTASPTGGTWTIDYSQSTGAGIAFTDLAIDGTTNTKFTSSLNPVGKSMVGNVFDVTAGTGFTTGRFEVNSVTGTAGTADRSLGTLSSTGGTASLGGALASPGGAAGALGATGGAGAAVWIKSGTYTMGSGTSNTDGNVVNSNTAGIWWIGFGSVRGDGGTKPVIQPSATSLTLMTLGNTGYVMENLEFRSNSQASTVHASVGSNAIVRKCKFNAPTGAQGLTLTGPTHVIDCECTGGTTNGFLASSSAGAKFIRCISHGNGSAGFNDANGDTSYDRCVAYSNGGAGFSTNSNVVYLSRCVAYSNGGGGINSGFVMNSAKVHCIAWGCIAEGNGIYGFDLSTSTSNVLIDCATYNNGTAGLNGIPRVLTNFLALSGSPFTNASGADFTLNNTAGAGRAVKALSYTLPALSPTGYLDAGAYGTSTTAGATDPFRPRPRAVGPMLRFPRRKAG